MKVCPQCESVLGFNSYFGAYICDKCGWEDDTYNRERIRYYSKRIENVFFTIPYDLDKVTIDMNCSNMKKQI